MTKKPMTAEQRKKMADDLISTLKTAAEKHFGVKGVTVEIKLDKRKAPRS